MNHAETQSQLSDARILAEIHRVWGYDQMRPLQADAIRAGVAARDSLVVLPTGGGKSLCYQVPALVAGRTDVVVSPLIALMKDQVDGLRAVGYPAVALHSGLAPVERREAERSVAQGECRLVFVSPERLLTPWLLEWIKRRGVGAFAIDEAHCISQWGHDFRPEYRRLALLREHFPDASLHAFTATATPRVRHDIANQLQLRNPEVLVGCFDRPNLNYRILPLVDVRQQTLDILKRHDREAAIVYCISRRDTETMTAWLTSHAIRAACYHAGLDTKVRHQVQEAFAQEQLDVVVATVAFGMGIDRSNVRCVIHAAMPKSIEQYQQETGRAGRDGLEAECVLFYSGADVIRWRTLLEKSSAEAGQGDVECAAQIELLQQMARFCNVPHCRHRALSEYFGQSFEGSPCGACDVCLGEVEGITEALVVAQKILSCVARTGERFGVGHVVDVLVGADTDMVRRCGHQRLSTYALLADTPRKAVMNYVYQLVDQQLLARTAGDRPILQLNEQSWQVMRGDQDVVLMRPKTSARDRRAKQEDVSWEGVDQALFERLREFRKELAGERQVPAYVICGDRTLRHLASARPTSLRQLHDIHGLGEKRIADFGADLVRLIGGG